LAYKSGRSTPLPLLGFFDVNKSGQLGYAYWINQDKLKSFTSKVVSAFGRDPINATIRVVDGNLEVVPDQDGFRVDQKVLTSLIQMSIADGKDQNLRLEPKYVKAPLRVNDLDVAKNRAEELLNHNIVLIYEGKQFVPDRKAKGYWLTFTHEQKQDGSVSLVVGVSREQVLGYLQSVANQVDVAPINKKITVVNGIETVEREGQEGRAINQEPAADQIVSALNSNQGGTITLTSRPLAYIVEKKRIGNCSSQDVGKVIEVNLSKQNLIACQDGQVIFTTPITSGATGAGFPTVTGQFAIYAKERSRYLNGAQYGYNYNVYVDYWMPFSGGYGLHDADWRSSFGGPDYYYGGSHGCVNMPKSAAAFLFGWAPVGTPVWVHY
jgi:lipoprotein-anchoring transpeptidase ErfK/SrfK